MKILLVEDEFEKKRLISHALFSVSGLRGENVLFASNLNEARRLLSQLKFDLLILDLNIPDRADSVASHGRGLEILDFIKTNDRAIVPSYVIGMSAYEDAIASASRHFSIPIWRLITFSYESDIWIAPLKEAVEFLQRLDAPPYQTDGNSFRTDVAIIAALPEELAAVKQLPGRWSDCSLPHDSSRYLAGSVTGSRGDLTVVATACPRMGMPPAAVIATKLIHSFRPRYIFICGICAGVRGKVGLGDIIVADPCFDWGSGKWVRANPDGPLKFRPAPYQWRLDQDLRSSIEVVADEPGLLRSIYNRYEAIKPGNAPSVFIEAMASGGSVLQAAELVEDVQDQHKNLVGVDMETYAVFTASEYCSKPRPICVSIKAVCDFGDEKKTDSFHSYASFVSAQFIHSVLARTITPLYEAAQ